MTGNDYKQAHGDDIVQETATAETGGAPETGENSGESDPPDDRAKEEYSTEDLLRQELDAAVTKAQENLDLARRTQADMENLRKRTSRDIENAHKYALERFVNELLPVIDSLELGIQASESAADAVSLKEGMSLTLKKFTDTLEKFGVVVVDPLGEKFNPDRHDAVSMAETDEYEAGTVMSVLQKGYELNGRLVRPAMVVVSK